VTCIDGKEAMRRFGRWGRGLVIRAVYVLHQEAGFLHGKSQRVHVLKSEQK
jgi:hypothetical protein